MEHHLDMPLARVLEVEPGSARTLNNLAVARKHAGQLARAEEHLRRALAIAQGDWTTLVSTPLAASLLAPPALAKGRARDNAVVSASILLLIELIQDLLPPGILNIVNGFGIEAGKPLATNPRINKIAFTGETTTGRLIMQYASQNIIPSTVELGGKSPNIFFDDVMDEDDDYFNTIRQQWAKALSEAHRQIPPPDWLSP